MDFSSVPFSNDTRDGRARTRFSGQLVVWPGFVPEIWYLGTKTPEKHVGEGPFLTPPSIICYIADQTEFSEPGTLWDASNYKTGSLVRQHPQIRSIAQSGFDVDSPLALV